MPAPDHPNKLIGDLLKADPLHLAEQITGTSYKEDDFTGFLGLQFAIGHNAMKRDALLAVDDTTLSITTDRYLRIAREEGFRVLMEDPFTGTSALGLDLFYVLWHDDGILLKFDTYGDNVNGGKFCYNVRPKDPSDFPWDVLSSHGPAGGGDSGIRYGDHDCREALRFNLARLREHFEFVTPWIEPPFAARHLLNYQEWKLPDSERTQVAAERLGRLPLEVRQAMGLAPREMAA